jgi:hypothetical protein
MPKETKKEQQLLLTPVPGGNAMEIHVYGEHLSNPVFLRIVEIMRINKESANLKAVRFVVYSAMMHTNLRYAIPSGYYVKIEIRSVTPEKGGLKDAAGM